MANSNLTGMDECSYVYTADFNSDSMDYSISRLKVSDYIDESVNKVKMLEDKVNSLEERLRWVEGEYMALKYSITNEVKKIIDNMSLDYVKHHLKIS